MKKILVLLSLVCVWPLTGHAQDVDGKAETEFQANNGTVSPVDPDEGHEVLLIYPPTNGPLSLSYAADLSTAPTMTFNFNAGKKCVPSLWRFRT